jgi:uncharacterized protein (TIRG00374 family)
MEKTAPGHRALVVSVIIGFALLGALVVAMDGDKALRVIGRADWRALVSALIFTAVSYFCLTEGYTSINRIFGIRLDRRAQLEVGFVSFALNNLIAVGGAAGYSLRTGLLRRRGFALEDILGASLVHSYFNHLVMMGLLPVGLVYLLVNHPLGQRRTAELFAATALTIVVLGATTALLFGARARSRAALLLAGLGRHILRRDFGPALRNLDATLGRGIAAICRQPRVLGAPLVLVLADWAACVVALGFCFRALGEPLHPGVLITGFAIGVTLGLVSMLPGGMGVQEGSMTGVYVLLGVNYEKAVLAAIVFRAIYYLVPFVVSLFLYANIARRTRASVLASLAALAIGITASPAAAAEETLSFGRFGTVHLYFESPQPRNVVLFVSGDGGWNAGVVDMAHDLAGRDALVVGIDIVHYLAQLETSNDKCSYPAADFEALSQFVQKRRDAPRYSKPILVGYSSGATLVYAIVVQAPPTTFKGAISLGFCPDLPLTKPFCKGSGLEFDPGPMGRGVLFRPARALEVPWIALQGTIDQVCDPEGTREYVGKVRGAQIVMLPRVGHGYSVPRNWLPQFQQAFEQVASAPDHSEPPAAAVDSLADLPLSELEPRASATDQLAVLWTGDGGYGVTDKGIAHELASHGIAVVVVNSQHYFWTPRTPEGASHDLERILRHYLRAWNKERVVYVGYSHGADVLPFLLNRLPKDLRDRTDVVALLGISARADFEFHMMDLIRDAKRPTARPTLPELEQLRGSRLLVFYGTEDEDTIGPQLDSTLVEKHAITSGHRFGSNYGEIVAAILKTAGR